MCIACVCVCVRVRASVHVCVRVCVHKLKCVYFRVYCIYKGTVCKYNTYISLSLQLDVAIGHEMTCQYEQALGMYNDLHLLLEQTIAKHSSHSRSSCPHWLKKMTSSWYQYWDCPNLTHPEKAWKVGLQCIYRVVIFNQINTVF